MAVDPRIQQLLDAPIDGNRRARMAAAKQQLSDERAKLQLNELSPRKATGPQS